MLENQDPAGGGDGKVVVDHPERLHSLQSGACGDLGLGRLEALAEVVLEQVGKDAEEEVGADGALDAGQLQQSLGAGQEEEPIRPREDAAGGGEEDAIGLLPAWTANLAFENAELMAEGEDLGTEPGVGMAATTRISRRRRPTA